MKYKHFNILSIIINCSYMYTRIYIYKYYELTNKIIYSEAWQRNSISRILFFTKRGVIRFYWTTVYFVFETFIRISCISIATENGNINNLTNYI